MGQRKCVHHKFDRHVRNGGTLQPAHPGYSDVDAAIRRTFKLTESFILDTRVEGFDVTNHPNFGGPTPSIGDGLGENTTFSLINFGRNITSGDPRILQGPFKIIF